MDVAAVVLWAGAAYLYFYCPVVQMEPWGNHNMDGLHVNHWIHQCIVALAALLGSICECAMLCVAASLLLEETVKYIDSTKVLECGCNYDAPFVGVVAKVNSQVANQNNGYMRMALPFVLQDAKLTIGAQHLARGMCQEAASILSPKPIWC